MTTFSTVEETVSAPKESEPQTTSEPFAHLLAVNNDPDTNDYTQRQDAEAPTEPSSVQLESSEPLGEIDTNDAQQNYKEEASTITFTPLPQSLPFMPTPLSLKQWLQVYLSITVLCNFLLIFFNSHGSDLNFWFNWASKLTANGYANFEADYPPLYLHWLYIAGHIINAAGGTIEGNDLLKFMSQLPVTGCHCLLVYVIYSLLKESHATRVQFHCIMLLTVLNPAILFDGPVWSQVDLIPSTIALCGMLLCFHPRLAFLGIPVYMLSLMAKFQMICFAPVFAIIFFSRPAVHLVGIGISIGVFLLAFMPFILVGHLSEAFQNAYIKTLGSYPYSTLNAANLWILVTGNTAPDHSLVFPVSPDSGLYKLATAKSIGMISFALFCIAVFAQGLHRLIQQTYLNQPLAFKAYGIQLAMFCAVAFFTLLPAMHERYLFPAVVCSLAYVAIIRHKYIYPILISGISAVNMIIIMGVNGSDIWIGLSSLMVFVFVLAIAESVFGERLHQKFTIISTKIARIPALSLWVFIISGALMFSYLINRYEIQKPDLAENQKLLTDIPTIHIHQDHGTLEFNRSFDKNTLSVGGQRYASGLGTHANSVIRYQLPENATEFSFIAGLDDEVGTADVVFTVKGDGRQLWQSPIIRGNEKAHPVQTLDIRGVKVLELEVYSSGNDHWDHADWINPIVTFEKPESLPASLDPQKNESQDQESGK